MLYNVPPEIHECCITCKKVEYVFYYSYREDRYMPAHSARLFAPDDFPSPLIFVWVSVGIDDNLTAFGYGDIVRKL